MKNTALLFASLLLLALACTTSRKPIPPNQRPPQKRDRTAERPPKREPVDTVRWNDRPGQKPPIGRPDDQRPSRPAGDTYRIGVLLPFLTGQFDEGSAVPEKSTLALQFYAGVKVALEHLSKQEGLNLVVDVYDTGTSDADFQQLYRNSRFDKSDVYIGPIRANHVGLLAARAKANRKILISPESPSTELTTQNPDFIQVNPSLRAHCAAILRHALKQTNAEAVTLVCRERESDRLPYFHGVNSGKPLNELVVPDATENFNNIDLRPYLRGGRTNVFILPTWSSQDFVVAFLRKLKASKGSNAVAVYGMPQWQHFEGLDAEFLVPLNVHISSASFINYDAPMVKAFQQAFYTATGTIPDEDGFNGYDVTMFAGRMLKKYGLSFPERLPREFYDGLRADYRFGRVNASGPLDTNSPNFDYIENTYVYILRFDSYGFVPATD
jgi:hypothetical protein